MIYQKIVKTPIGDICILEENDKIIGLTLDNEKYCYKEKNTEILNETEKQLNEYFCGKRKNFNVPINPKGTEFQKQVWNELLKIPYGQTVTYKRIAQKIKRDFRKAKKLGEKYILSKEKIESYNDEKSFKIIFTQEEVEKYFIELSDRKIKEYIISIFKNTKDV